MGLNAVTEMDSVKLLLRAERLSRLFMDGLVMVAFLLVWFQVIRYIADQQGHIIGREEATPECSIDFCDNCGDCLACQIEDRCPGGEHRWVRYEGDE